MPGAVSVGVGGKVVSELGWHDMTIRGGGDQCAAAETARRRLRVCPGVSVRSWWRREEVILRETSLVFVGLSV